MNLNGLKKPELLEFARELGLQIAETKRKQEFIDAIERAGAEHEELSECLEDIRQRKEEQTLRRNEAESPLRLLPSARKEALRRVGYSRKKRVRPPPTERTPYAELDTHEESVCRTFHCRVAKPRRSRCIEAESTDYA
ncbi:hypothetical protein HPB51_014882 [Rhipicephalus microplus]|uniref:Rho termination factor-like N-terminal domain-containing protein n=1 Tax=Rhipicephalus microplus TaxID=6941 RepID=A0A9J6DGT2_RHIMP|nr:hypothetical protein HPB51_014882 [Rhipicephalus microplus]